MANIVEIPNTTQPLIQHYIDQMGADEDKKKQFDLQQQQIDNEKNYQQGSLSNQTAQLNQSQQLASAKTMLDGWQSRMSEGDPTVAKEAQDYIAAHPEMKPYLAAAAMYHASNGQQAQGVAQQKHLADNQAVLGGSTDPNQVNVQTHDVTGSFMPPEGFKQQQATDLSRIDKSGAATPNLASNNPAPSGNAVPDYEARATGALTTAPENLTAQTQIKTTGMQIAAEAPYRAAMTREATAKAAISEGQQKMMSGDPSASNSFAVGVLVNPRSFDQLTTDEKRMAVAGLGGRAPAKLSSTEETQFDSALNTMDGVRRATGILQKWKDRGVEITGPMLGRFEAATNSWGDSILPSNLPPQQAQELQGDIAALQQNFGINKLNELRAVTGGRVPAAMVDMIQAPSIAQNPSMLRGALGGMYEIANGRTKELENKIWNGHPPTLSGATAAQYQNVVGGGAPGGPVGAGATVLSQGEAWAQKYKQPPQPPTLSSSSIQ